jgi:hypothetical protein
VKADEEFVLDVELVRRRPARNYRDSGKAVAPRFSLAQNALQPFVYNSRNVL